MRRTIVGIATFIVVCLLALLWTPLLRGQSGGQATIATLPDITGTGATVALATSGTARWVQLTAASTNAALVRWGGPSTSATQGSFIAAGGGQFVPPLPMNQNAPVQNFYALSNIYVYIASGDKVNVTYGQ